MTSYVMTDPRDEFVLRLSVSTHARHGGQWPTHRYRARLRQRIRHAHARDRRRQPRTTR